MFLKRHKTRVNSSKYSPYWHSNNKDRFTVPHPNQLYYRHKSLWQDLLAYSIYPEYVYFFQFRLRSHKIPDHKTVYLIYA